MTLNLGKQLQIFRLPAPLFTLVLLLAFSSQPSSAIQIPLKTSLQRAVATGRLLGISEESGLPSPPPSSRASSGSRMHPLGFPCPTERNKGFKHRTLKCLPVLIIPSQCEHNGRSASSLTTSPRHLGVRKPGVTWTFYTSKA